MNKKINILIIGNAYDNHMYRFIKNIHQNSNLINIDFYNYDEKAETEPAILDLCNNIYYKSYYFPKILYNIPILRTLITILDFRFGFLKKIPSSYNVINIHYVSIVNAFSLILYRNRSKILLLSPWGSDVLRIPSLHRFFLKRLYSNADYISIGSSGFKGKVQSIFKIKDSKIIDLKFGSDLIDTLKKNQNLNKNDAKTKLGLKDKYIITIGYNGSIGQKHIEVIDQINSVKDLLPNNLFLVIPMTYPSNNEEYINKVRNKMEEYEIPYLVYDCFLSNDHLLFVRKCADVFVHAQITDASSASLQEYILADCLVLNASWLIYPQFEKYGKPYYIFNTLEEIGSTLIFAISNHTPIKAHKSLKIDLYNNGWDSVILPWINFYLAQAKN